ncbi:MAG TPA: hypothetical protein VOA64_14985 [Candidatus Dormibacteraeota bacterium]|nr:hypothetical protein [Candidatus Dormibacteraeota bacterium]
MKFARTLLVAFAFAVCSAVAAFAQLGGMMRPPGMQGVFNPVVGTGAVYELTDKKQTKTNMEIAVVGKENVNGKDAYWIETGVQDPKSHEIMWIKMLVAKDQNNVVTERFITRIPGQPQPVEMSMSMATGMGGQSKSQPSDFRDKAEAVGTESVTVPAGTFTCEHFRMKDGSGEAWVSSKVAPWGLVKFTGKDASMVLLKQITDATSHITGAPIKLEDMMRQPH